MINPKSSDLIDGTITNGFNSLQDAIQYAYEIGANITYANVTILLKDGLHAMVRYNPIDFYMPIKIDQYSSSTSITIRPASDTTLTINYKLRDTFKFKVGRNLTI